MNDHLLFLIITFLFNWKNTKLCFHCSFFVAIQEHSFVRKCCSKYW